MKNVIAVIDIGKTNKKLFLFDDTFEAVFQTSVQFEEIEDEDGFPCDNIDAIENWIQSEIKSIQEKGNYKIKAINFSTHGATLLYLDKDGNRIAPLYNYLKPLDIAKFDDFFKKYGGVERFSRKTASPAYGMLNTGFQMLWMKYDQPEVWSKVAYVLHYPQYLSYQFSKKVTADFTSVGAHTATWDFDTMQYHKWINEENINLPEPCEGDEAFMADVNGEQIAIGTGLHDSSSSIIPIIDNHSTRNYVLLSTGTWIITMNPFSKETLTQHQLKNNCLCFMTPKKQQVKSSMQFLGRIHEVYMKPLSEHFNENINRHMHLGLNEQLYQDLIVENARIFLSEGIDTDFEAKPELLKKFGSYETAYYQLVYEISKKVITGINLILDKDSDISDVFISGGFNRNKVFTKFLKLLKKGINIRVSECKNESALGAALMMKKYL